MFRRLHVQPSAWYNSQDKTQYPSTSLPVSGIQDTHRTASIAFWGEAKATVVLTRSLPLAVLALAAFLAVLAITTYVFPYYSTNNDEAVYRFQAQMLAQGKLYLPADASSEHFNSFYIINDGQRIYPKYTPVFAIPLAASYLLFGDMRPALGLIAAAIVLTMYFVGREVYRRPIGLLAAFFLLLSPLFLVQSSMYLPYMFSFLLDLLFFLFFLKALRGSGRTYPILAGVAFGVNFFARPYTALSFALPMAAYAYYLVQRARLPLQTVAPMVASAAPFVVLTFAYNYDFTGNPLVFPFHLWEPRDTLGFGVKRLALGVSEWSYTPLVALESTGAQLDKLMLWVFGGPLLLVFVGVAAAARRLRSPEMLALAMGGAVVAGNFVQWGTLISRWGVDNLGPFYYLDLLLPLCLLGARGFSRAASLALRGLSRIQRDRRDVQAKIGKPLLPTTGLVAAFFVPCLVVSGLLMASRIDLNLRHTFKRAQVYAPVLQARLDNALVFVPPLYGPFLGIPFGYLSNTPTLDRPLLYARDMGNRNIDLVRNMSNRRPYYFWYQGIWDEEPGHIDATALVPLTLLEGKNITLAVEATNPTGKPHAVAYVWNQYRTETYVLDDASTRGKTYRFQWRIIPSGVEFQGPYVRQSGEVGLSTATTLNVAVAFSDTPQRETQDIYEMRFWFDIRDGKVRIVAPGESWLDLNWPTGRWTEKDVSSAIRVVVRADTQG